MDEVNLPNFLVVGAAKCGTTSLFHYLNQHPDIFILKRKEGRFFSQMPGNFLGGESADYQNDIIKSIDEYSKLFKTSSAKYRGDISNDYLYYYEKSIFNIKKYLDDDVNIFIILRNPVDRAYSNYLHNLRIFSETCSFEKAINIEQERIKNNYAWTFHYINTSLYYYQVKAYIRAFDQINIFIYEDYKNIVHLANNIFEILGVENIVLDEKIYNKRFVYRHKVFDHLNRLSIPKIVTEKMDKLGLLKFSKDVKEKVVNLGKNEPKKLSKELRNEVYQKYFKEEVYKMEKLLGRELDEWKIDQK